jgi:hypothetical protein
MPYKSEAQRRFFHSEGARKAGITPAMVQEWDDASRGEKRPERAHKKEGSLLDLFLKLAAAKQKTVGLMKAPTLSNVATANPGDYQPAFENNAGADAQAGSSKKLEEGNHLTMPS